MVGNNPPNYSCVGDYGLSDFCCQKVGCGVWKNRG
ncbi:hypothetical protein CNEO4_1780004 [Clostridium neonatale]|nr:hypothetical protein CNEO3_1300004 [Clostridium neonatale]CAI3612697.1 hypothetical protein CNEO4_1780004 [Clostridium neonatale]CAI4138783.1 hypothetical protein CNEO4_1500005 [Clostridium neonatale]